MTEKQQAMRDALTAIIKSRQPVPEGSLPPGDINLPIDPELLQPESQQQPKENQKLKIDDPDNLLKQQQKKQKQPRQPHPQKPQGKGPQGPQGEGPQGPQGKGPQGPQGKGPQGPQGKGPQGPQGAAEDEDKEDDIKEKGNGPDHDISDDFAKAWNEIIARYDNDDITDDQLQKLLGQIQLGLINTL